MGFKNPFGKRQGGQNGAYKASFGGYNFDQALAALRNDLGMSDRDFAVAMGPNAMSGQVCNDVHMVHKWRAVCEAEITRLKQIEAANQAAPATSTQPQSVPTSSGMTRTSSGDRLELVNYSPEELVKQVDERIATIQFGWTKTIKWMEGWSEVWSWAGPVILLLGTIGEVFMVLWLRQKQQEILAGISIVAVAFVLEGTFLTVSYKSATIRGRAERRPGGPSQLDKAKMKKQMFFWFALATGVCASQIIFVVAQTKTDGIGTYGVWAFAILRSVFTLVADGYTAFAHEEKPTTDERALEEQQHRAKAVKEQLEQSRENVRIFNEGILSVRESVNEAEIRDVKQRARLETEKLQADQQVAALRQQNELAAMMTGTFTKMIAAMIDPSISDEERQHSLRLMQAFTSVQQSNGHVKEITEDGGL